MGAGIRRVGRHITWLLAPALGLFFLVAVAAKALDPVAFAAQVEAYEIVSGAGLTRALAWTIIAAECVLAACLLAGVQRRRALLGGGVLLALFAAVSAWAWVQGQQHACGCFGTFVERTPAETFFEDLVLLACVGLALSYRPATAHAPAGWQRLLTVSLAVLAFSVPPLVGRLDPALDIGKSISDLGLEAYLASEPDSRTIYAFLEPLNTGPDYDTLQALAYGGASVVALSTADSEEIEAFRWKSGPAFDIVNVSGVTLRRLSQDRPGAFLVKEGRVSAIWRDRIPADIDASLGVSARVPAATGEFSMDEEVRP